MMKSIVALICLCFVHQTMAAADTCLAKADLSKNCDPTPDDECDANTDKCSTITVLASCTGKSCIWTAGKCTDGCPAKDESACDAPCTVDGTCQECGDLATSSTCGEATGCNWDGSDCKDACPGSTVAEAACTTDNFCTWSSPSCTAKTAGTYCDDLAIASGGSCEMDSGCTVDSTCKAKVCGDHTDLADSGACDTDPGCKRDGPTPTACIAKDCSDFDTANECAAKGSCRWESSGTPVCVDKVQADCDRVACTADDDCAWSSGACAIKASLCSGKSDKTNCNAVTRCNWKFNTCQQPTGNCSAKDYDDCSAECEWDAKASGGLCSANATCAVHTTSVNCCTNECAWVDCTEKADGNAAAGMIKVVTSTLVLSLVVVKLL